jgi:hypothetical protein
MIVKQAGSIHPAYGPEHNDKKEYKKTSMLAEEWFNQTSYQYTKFYFHAMNCKV